MSRLDRFMLSEEWFLTWPNCVQLAQIQGLSDHRFIVLSVDEVDLGPRPKRMLKCWVEIPCHKQFACDQ